MMETITVQTEIDAPVGLVWKCWTTPDDIVGWNAASDDWHTPWAKNDLREGGRFTSRMEAKDGSVGFDFAGTYTKVIQHEYIEYKMDDDRGVKIKFESSGKKTNVLEQFEAETMNSVEMQKNGWQAILENFKKYVETI